MEQAEGRNPAVVYERALQEGRPCDPLEGVEIALTFGEKSAGETRKEPAYGIQRHTNGRWILKDAGIGDDREELVDTGPGNTDGFRARDGLRQHLACAFVEGHLRTMRIDQQVRIDGDHAPCSR